MKRILFVVLVVLAVSFGCKKEPQVTNIMAEPVVIPTITLAIENIDGPLNTFGAYKDAYLRNEGTYWKDFILAEFTDRTGIPVDLMELPVMDGTTKLLDAEIIAGNSPDVAIGYGGRMSKYANDTYALALDVDTSAYLPSYISQLTKDGKLYGLPETAWGAAGVLNMTIVKELGLEITPPKWTMSDYEDLVREAVQHDYSAAFLFSGEESGDYYNLMWFGAAGAEYIRNGEIKINSPEGVACLTFLVDLISREAAPLGAEVLKDSDWPPAWMSGKVAFGGGVYSYASDMPQTALEDGHTDKPFEAAVMEFPRWPGSDSSPGTSGWDAAVVFKTTKHPAEATKLAEFITGKDVQTVRSNMGRFPSRNDVDAHFDNRAWEAIKNIHIENGVMDLALGYTEYSEIRTLWMQCLQKAFSKQLTPQEALDEFAKKGNEVLTR